jgi:hypothetical protein
MPKQKELPGIERQKVKAIEDAADDYVAVRDKRMALTEKEVEAREVLLALMDKHGLTNYRYDDQIISVLPARKVKVKHFKDDADSGDE